jgi:cytochrome oxidase Cu insertion factor (SCO1/SenC/PrrC family)
MQSHSSDASVRPPRSTLTLWLILAVCAAPVIGSYIAYYFWQPAGHVNYGELIEPRPVPDAVLELTDGRHFRLSDLKGEWLLLAADRAACDERCRLKLTYMRQMRLAQGKEKERIERVWLVTDRGAPDRALLAEHPGLAVVREQGSVIAKSLPAAVSPAEHIYVIDPHGNVMMRFPRDADPRRMLKDISRLLRHSKWK